MKITALANDRFELDDVTYTQYEIVQLLKADGYDRLEIMSLLNHA